MAKQLNPLIVQAAEAPVVTVSPMYDPAMVAVLSKVEDVPEPPPPNPTDPAPPLPAIVPVALTVGAYTIAISVPSEATAVCAWPEVNANREVSAVLWFVPIRNVHTGAAVLAAVLLAVIYQIKVMPTCIPYEGISKPELVR